MPRLLGFRVEDLLDRAQVGLPTVSKHFGDKEGCYLGLFDPSRRTTTARDSGPGWSTEL